MKIKELFPYLHVQGAAKAIEFYTARLRRHREVPAHRAQRPRRDTPSSTSAA